MEIVLNASLAGGVMIGSSADLVRNPAISILIGFAAGIISSYGFARLSGFLGEKISLHDTCGVHNLHGIPGALGGLIGAIIASSATEDQYGADLTGIWGARAPTEGEGGLMVDGRNAKA